MNYQCHKLVDSNVSSRLFFESNGEHQSAKSFRVKDFSKFKNDNRGAWEVDARKKGSLFWEWMAVKYAEAIKELYDKKVIAQDSLGVQMENFNLKNKTEDEIIDLI